MMVAICAQCDGVMQENIVHHCVRGLATTINRQEKTLESIDSELRTMNLTLLKLNETLELVLITLKYKG